MSLVDQQVQFSLMFAQLVLHARSVGIPVVIAEVMRTTEQQRWYVEHGQSQTMRSKHREKLAGDLLVFKDGVYCTTIDAYRPLGAFWKSLHPANVWGGDWTTLVDAGHFQYGT